MIFDGIVTIDGTVLTYELIHINGINIGNHELYRSPCGLLIPEFEIASRGSFAIQDNALYLIGNQDQDHSLPVKYSINFGGEARLNTWIDNYKKAFESINGCQPIINDISKFIFEMEDSPEFNICGVK